MAVEWDPPRLDEWCAVVDSEPGEEWLIPDFIPADAAILVSGAPKRSFKTWLVFSLAIVLASGKPLGPMKPVRSLPVLIIELEGPRRLTRRRFKFLEAGFNISMSGLPIYFSHRDNVLIDEPTWLRRVHEFVVERGVGLVIIDTFAKANRGDENSVRDVTKCMFGIDAIRKAGCSVIFVHHLRKPSMEGSQDPDDDVRGTSALAGYYDTHIAVRKPNSMTRENTVYVRCKDNDEKMFSMIWDISQDTESAVLHLDSVQQGEITSTFVHDCLASLMPGQIYSEAILKSMWGMSKDKVKQILDQLVHDGRLTKEGYRYKVEDIT